MAGIADLFMGGYSRRPTGLGSMYAGDQMNRFPMPPGLRGQLPPGLMRLAGDVVQMPMGGQLDAIRRLIQPGVNPGAQGNLSINQLGPRQLDLLNILRYPGGGQMLPPIGRRGDLAPPMRGEEFA